MVPGWTETVCTHSPVDSSPTGVTARAEVPECGAVVVRAASAGPPEQRQPGTLPQSASEEAGISNPGLVARLTAGAAAVGAAADDGSVDDGAATAGPARPATSSAAEAASAGRREGRREGSRPNPRADRRVDMREEMDTWGLQRGGRARGADARTTGCGGAPGGGGSVGVPHSDRSKTMDWTTAIVKGPVVLDGLPIHLRKTGQDETSGGVQFLDVRRVVLDDRRPPELQ